MTRRHRPGPSDYPNVGAGTRPIFAATAAQRAERGELPSEPMAGDLEDFHRAELRQWALDRWDELEAMAGRPIGSVGSRRV